MALGSIMFGIGIFSQALGTMASINNAKAQANAQASAYEAQAQMAEYNAKVAEQNSKLAESQASAEARQGYENMQSMRLKGAKAIGAQRAAAGGSGAVVDIGSNLDLTIDTAQLSEIDAINEYNKGIDQAYNYQIQGWQYRNQANSFRAESQSYMNAASSTRSSASGSAWSAALGGIASIGNAFGQTTTWWNY